MVREVGYLQSVVFPSDVSCVKKTTVEDERTTKTRIEVEVKKSSDNVTRVNNTMTKDYTKKTTKVEAVRPTRSTKGTTPKMTSHKSALFEFIENEKWDKVVRIAETNLAEVSKWSVLTPSNTKDDGTKNVLCRCLPLHATCSHNPPESVMRILMEAYPEAVRATDSTGRLPLHHACCHGASERVIELLLMSHPESLNVKDIWGRTPLATAESSSLNSKNKIQIIDALLKRPSYYAARSSELRHNVAEKQQRDAFAAAFEKKFAETKKKHAVAVAGLEDTVAELRATVTDLERKVKTSAAQEEHYKNEHTIISSKNDELVVQLKHSTVAIDKLQASEDNLKWRYEELGEQRKDLEDRLDESLKREAESSATIILLEKKYSDNDTESRRTIALLEAQLSDVSKSKASETEALTGQMKALESQIAKLNEVNAEVNSENGSLKATTGVHAAQLNDLKASIARKDEEMEKLVRENSNITAENLSLMNEAAQLEQEVEMIRDANAALEDELGSEIVQVATLAGEVEADRVEISTLEQEKHDLSQTNMEMHQKLKAMELEVKAAKQRADSLETELATKTDDLQTLQTKLNASRDELRTLQKQSFTNSEEECMSTSQINTLRQALSNVYNKTTTLLQSETRLEKMVHDQARELSAAGDDHARLMTLMERHVEGLADAHKSQSLILSSLKIAMEQMNDIDDALTGQRQIVSLGAKQGNNIEDILGLNGGIRKFALEQKKCMRDIQNSLNDGRSDDFALMDVSHDAQTVVSADASLDECVVMEGGVVSMLKQRQCLREIQDELNATCLESMASSDDGNTDIKENE
mmetsp:Transcript_12625/g.15909  ORF Transcript_12625/g.15909 Transcript_12625/m.15909 type:complete len:815 (+) Transcript_12625:42-2486(+)|eukprot:CAMPEP_0172514714 /NCGR_PEP_ID=MMETSP1066-20121228/262170_1 /TAXON_ID=671091 /ORGANISM="Coscinodiscus wailesii, Strain CCMP2513" /LENGTH=814 /DNA_ID=CAMNT_0013295487 /DNA_START=42 /DNA_END=2486 /DNA_ORIENTATION=+